MSDVAEWPTSLPYPSANNYQEQPQSQVIRTGMDAGIDKVRRRFTSGTRQFSCMWYFTHEQLATFELWFYHTIAAGSLPFTMPKPRHGMSGTPTINVRFYVNRGEPGYTVSYADQYRQWQVSARMEQIP